MPSRPSGTDFSSAVGSLPTRGLSFRKFSVAIGPGGQNFATGAWNGEIRIWNAQTGALRHRLDALKSPISALGFRSANRLISIHADGTVEVG